MLVKQLSVRIQKEAKGGNILGAATLVFCLSIAFLVLVLGLIVHDHFKKFVLYEDLYLSPLNAFPPLFSVSVSQTHPPMQQCPNKVYSLKDRISSQDVWHSMTDEELMWLASMVPRIVEYPFNRTPKVAFMFLARGSLPLAPLWEMFFKGHERLFTIYLHMSSDFTYEPPDSSIFYNRRIPSKPVQWGTSTMIDAKKRLLANALLDFSNERFVLLSETCIPLFNFTTIYNYLINSNQSFLSTFHDPRTIGRGRYNNRMWPKIALSDRRKGSRWFEASRELAISLVSDVTYYPVFKNHCVSPCCMDEHYFPTLVNKICPNLTSNRTVTWTDWSGGGGGSHPAMFRGKDVTEGFLYGIRDRSNCTYNGKMTSICFLFAEKFHPSTLQTLLMIAPKILAFNP